MHAEFDHQAQVQVEKEQDEARQQKGRDDIEAAYHNLGFRTKALTHLQAHAHVEQTANVRLIVSIWGILDWMGGKLSGYSADTPIEPDMITRLSGFSVWDRDEEDHQKKSKIPSALYPHDLARPLRATTRQQTSGMSVLTAWQAMEKQRTDRLDKVQTGEWTQKHFERQNRENPLPKDVTQMYKAIYEVLIHIVFDPLTFWQNKYQTKMMERVNEIRAFLGLEPHKTDPIGQKQMREVYRERVLERQETFIAGEPVSVWCYPQKCNKDWVVVYYLVDGSIKHIREHDQWTWPNNGTGKESSGTGKESRFFARLTPQGVLKHMSSGYKPLMHQPYGRTHGKSLVERTMQLMLDLGSGAEVAADELVDNNIWHEDFFNKDSLETLLDTFFSLDGKMGRERFTPDAKSTLMGLIWQLTNSQLLSLYEVMAHCGRKTIKSTDHAVVGAIRNKDETSGIYDDPLIRWFYDNDFLSNHPDLLEAEVFRVIRDDIALLGSQASDGQGSSGNGN